MMGSRCQDEFPRSGLPAAGIRGGNWNNGTQAGAFSVNLNNAPSNSNNNIGFRCARKALCNPEGPTCSFTEDQAAPSTFQP
jgi:hypothetical protein